MKRLFNLFATVVLFTKGARGNEEKIHSAPSNSTDFFPGCDNTNSTDWCASIWGPENNYSVPTNQSLVTCYLDQDCCPGGSPTGYVDCTMPIPPSESDSSDALRTSDWWFIAHGISVLMSGSYLWVRWNNGQIDHLFKAIMMVVMGGAISGMVSEGLAIGFGGDSAAVKGAVAGEVVGVVLAGLMVYKKRNLLNVNLNQPLLDIKTGCCEFKLPCCR